MVMGPPVGDCRGLADQTCDDGAGQANSANDGAGLGDIDAQTTSEDFLGELLGFRRVVDLFLIVDQGFGFGFHEGYL